MIKAAGLALSLLWAGAVNATEVRLSAPTAGDDLQDDLRAASLAIAANEEKATKPQDLLAAARADYAQLIGVLYAMGYYSPVINILVDGREAASIPPFATPKTIDKIRLKVTPGPKFKFSQARVAPLANSTVLPEGFAVGEPAKSTLIQEAAQAGVSGYRDVGFAKARIAGQNITADHRARTLAADIQLDPGRRLQFGDLIITSESRVREKRIREIAGLPSGETFSPEELEDAASRLRRSGAFRSVALLEAETPNADDTLDIEAALVDEKKRRFGFGAEVSSLEGLGVSAYWMHRNLLGGAERLRIEGEVKGIAGDSGGVDYRLGATITRPATFDEDTRLLVLGELEELDEPDFFERKATVGASLFRQFSDVLEVGAGVRFRYSEVRDDLGERTFTHLTIPVTAAWDRRNNPLNPVGGFYLQATGEPFVGVSGSQSGARVYADARAYEGLGADDRFVVAGRLQFGSVIGAEIVDVPPDMLFFSGGGGTVRGQPYQSLNVDLPSGDSTGGRAFLGASAEVRVGVTDSISVVGFADAGFIGADSWPGDNGAWHSGAGLGLRYETGIGPIRLDVATPIGGATGDGIHIYVGIGQAF
ncbi:autotransporter assembly complex protein TamA [Actibacterium lipolyticum]|nr:autotransporter assembly complex family protein [Actibacterium lipolyticum]